MVLDDLRRIVRALRLSSRSSERRLGVTAAQLFVLKVLAGARSRTMGELAALTRTHQSTVSVVVKRLVARGLVHRATSTRDARCVELRLAPAGRRLLRKAPAAAQERLIEGVERLPPRERKALAAALHRLTREMRLAEDDPSMFFEDDA